MASALVLALLLCSPTVAIGQDALDGGLASGSPGGGSRGDASWSIGSQPETVRPGERLAVQLQVSIDEGWYMYALDSPAGKPLRVDFDSLPRGVALQTPLHQTVPTKKYDPNFDSEAFFFEDQAEVQAGFQVADSLEAGTYELRGSVRYMVCNDQMCMPPRTEELTVQTTVEGGAPRDRHLALDHGDLEPPMATADGATSQSAQTGSAASPAASGAAGVPGSGSMPGGGGLLGFLLLAGGAGVGALFMPCVFPMIPLTVSYFTGHAGSRGEALRQAGIYGLTIIGTFTGLGMLAAALIGASGAQSVAANPWVNLFIGAVLVTFALSLLGMFELRLPSSVVNYFDRASNRRSGYSGAVFMGLTLTVVTFSCTAPFVGGLLAAASQGTWAYPALGMLVFSGVLALPFVGFALFPSGLDRLPDSGGWMNALKVTFGFVELAAALKFFSNADLVWGTALLSRPLVIAFTVVLFALAGVYLLGKLRLPLDPPREDVQQIGVGRMLAATLFLGLALYMTPGLWGASLGTIDAYLPPRQGSDPGRLAVSTRTSKTPVDELDWNEDDIDAAVASAKETGKPIFVDFTGYTCTNCREMEANVFPTPVVAEHLRENFVLLRLYTDDAEKGPTFQRYQQKRTGTVALPTYAVLNAEEALLAQHSGMASPNAFDAFLEKGLAAADAPPASSGSTASAGAPSSNIAAGASSP